MPRSLALLLALLFPVALAGCPTSTPADDDDSGAADDDDDDAADDDDDAACDDDDATPQDDCTLEPCAATADTGVVGGTITDASGAGLRSVSLTV